ncbi:FtsK/SpoIIIE family DNA translocase [Orenia marismortui]|uniref:DNA translocase FtsK n=1 Tax=Orenia marismortui TaxID=46469 RepID=A0A4R8GSA2_9FIRM|nr:DNA translocase FtsK [Orenia marismortui]TDX45421.1 DNA translocase FtsK [Orenia marismortui]
MKETLKEIFNKRKYEFCGIVLIVMAILILLSLWSNDVGVVGNILNQGFRYIIGQGVYGIPAILAFLGLTMIYRSKNKIGFTPRTIGFIIIFLVTLAVIHLKIEHPLELKFALEGKGGGLIGGVFVYILRKSFAEYGTYVLLSAFALVGILLILDVLLVNVFLKCKENFKKFIGLFANSSTKDKNKSTKKIISKEKNSKKKSKVKLFINKFKRSGNSNKKKSTKQEGNNTTKKSNKSKQRNYNQPVKKIINSNKKEKSKKNNSNNTINSAFKEVAVNSEQKVKRNKIVIGQDDSPKKRINKKIESKEVMQPHLDLDEYQLPPLSLLDEAEDRDIKIIDKADVLRHTLDSFGVQAEVSDVNYGPTITSYEIQPAPGVKVSKIVNLADDIALSLAAPDVRIQAPIPGKAAVGIEIPNDQQSVVTLREMLESPEFQNAKSKLTMALGKDIGGRTLVADLGDMPHMLVAGSTGSGKSVFINTVINSILYKSTPDEVKFLLIDPKMVEFSAYQKIPHLVAPVVTDSKKAATALRWVVQEMENRYELFAGTGARGIDSYNNKLKEEGSDPLPYVVVIIDELADLMMVAAKEVEDAICRLAQKARAAGIHLILATQRPSVDVITGLIKANIPTRVSFSLSSQADSRTILDTGGAEKLLGKGDMLFSPVGSNQPKRLQGAFISDHELQQVVSFVKEQKKPEYAEKIAKIKEKNIKIELDDEKDELYEKAVRLVVKNRASISMLQRKLRIGYNRAARMIDRMEKDKIVGEYRGSKAREVLIKEEDLNKILGKN